MELGYSADERKYLNTLLGHLRSVCAINNVQFYRGKGAAMAMQYYLLRHQRAGAWAISHLQPVQSVPEPHFLFFFTLGTVEMTGVQSTSS